MCFRSEAAMPANWSETSETAKWKQMLAMPLMPLTLSTAGSAYALVCCTWGTFLGRCFVAVLRRFVLGVLFGWFVFVLTAIPRSTWTCSCQSAGHVMINQMKPTWPQLLNPEAALIKKRAHFGTQAALNKKNWLRHVKCCHQYPPRSRGKRSKILSSFFYAQIVTRAHPMALRAPAFPSCLCTLIDMFVLARVPSIDLMSCFDFVCLCDGSIDYLHSFVSWLKGSELFRHPTSSEPKKGIMYFRDSS